jgi:hypothetical protein
MSRLNNKKWYTHKDNLDKLYIDLLKYQLTHPETTISHEISLIGKIKDTILNGKIIDELF